MVSFNSRNSPRTSTVIFLVKSPFATAVVTVAMLRTYDVRLDAIRLTLSVRSFHVPATPLTFAWPPSFPSVPTSRATRFTSEANAPSWFTIVFTVFAPLNFHRHALRKVTFRDGADHARGFANRMSKAIDECVD